MNHFNREAEKGLSAFDQTHSIKFNYSYELPFGPDKKYLREGVAAAVFGGWRIAGVHAYASGYPLTVFPGYGLPLNAGDNRITVLDYEGWRAPTQGDDFNPLVDLWWDPERVQPHAGRFGGPARRLQGRRAARRLRQRHRPQPERARARGS